MPKKLFYLQSGILLAGTIFAWYTVVGDFVRFYNFESTIFKAKDYLVPNPVLAPCFYGAWVFLIAFLGSLLILKWSKEKQEIHQRRLLILLVAGTLFAWGNFGYNLIKFLVIPGQPTLLPGSVVLVADPFTTPCFVGALFFSAGLTVSLVIFKKQKSNSSLN